jgi:hypothetical protein
MMPGWLLCSECTKPGLHQSPLSLPPTMMACAGRRRTLATSTLRLFRLLRVLRTVRQSKRLLVRLGDVTRQCIYLIITVFVLMQVSDLCWLVL